MLFYEFVPLDNSILISAELNKFKCVILIERRVDTALRADVGRQLIERGCLYVMAWGRDCSIWDDVVDHELLQKFEYGEVPDDQFVMTTWHENQTLEEVIRFAKIDASMSYADEPLHDLLILDLGSENRETFIKQTFANVH